MDWVRVVIAIWDWGISSMASGFPGIESACGDWGIVKHQAGSALVPAILPWTQSWSQKHFKKSSRTLSVPRQHCPFPLFTVLCRAGATWWVVIGKEQRTQRDPPGSFGTWLSSWNPQLPHILLKEEEWGRVGWGAEWNHVLGSLLSLVGDKADFSDHISWLRSSLMKSL